jgi:hypothetical protein
MKKFLLLFFIATTCFAGEISLREKLNEATPGNYLVLEQNKNFTFLRIYDRKGERLSLEEVTIPLEAFAKLKTGWRPWFESGAPFHTSWTLSQVNLRTGRIEEVFSFTHNGWVHLDSADTFMPTLLNLHFQEVPVNERKHVGLPPGYGKPDHRPLWNPRLVVDGLTVPKVPFKAWKARWPADGSELARKIVEVYLPETVGGERYPAYFPYWLEVEGKLGSARIRVVDSGMEARTPRTEFPHRKPTLVGQERWEGDHLVIELSNPSHLTEFMVMAEECDSLLGKSFPIPYELRESDEKTLITMKREDISKVMTPGETYRFALSAAEEPRFVLETKKFQFN